jgi:cytoskeleton protein RodZ
MALFGTRRRARPRDEIERQEPDEPRLPRTVGTVLRDARLRQGGDRNQIAALLRIRPAYLAAIEDSRYDQLPGAAYALGFVRAYAEHLGLDRQEILRRFKAETAGLDRRQDLAVPMPLPDRSRPGAAILLVALIVAACAYALWWYFASGERMRPERVAAPPEEIAPPLPPPPIVAAPEAPPEPVPETTLDEPVAPAEPPPEAGEAPGAGAPEPLGEAPEAVPESAPAEAQSEPPAEPAAPAETAEPAVPVPPAPSAPPIAAALPPPPPPPLPDAAPQPEGPRVYGVTNGPARIVIRATADSWIQIRDADGSQARILRPGEIYRVPDRPGVTMRTGNAGGIEVTVDGEPAPALGQPGQTRNVALDPDRLLAGTAVIQ